MERQTKYEVARMVGSRALQIAMGAPFLIKLTEDQLDAIGYNPIRIAQKELEAGVLPITIKRPLPKAKAPPEPVKENKEAEAA